MKTFFIFFLYLLPVMCDSVVAYIFICLFQRILEAYRTGRGRIIVRGKTDVEVLDEKTKLTAIIIKEVLSSSFGNFFYMSV